MKWSCFVITVFSSGTLLINSCIVCFKSLNLLPLSTNKPVTATVQVTSRRMGPAGMQMVHPAANPFVDHRFGATIFDEEVRHVLDMRNGIADKESCVTGFTNV